MYLKCKFCINMKEETQDFKRKSSIVVFKKQKYTHYTHYTYQQQKTIPRFNY